MSTYVKTMLQIHAYVGGVSERKNKSVVTCQKRQVQLFAQQRFLCVPICPLQFLTSKIGMTVFFLHSTAMCEVLINNINSIGINIFAD